VCVSWQTLTDEAALAEVAAEWSRLAERADASLFVGPDWVNAWRATIAPDVKLRVVTARDPRGRLAAVWPLGIRTTGRGPARYRILEAMGGTVVSGDRLDPITATQGLEQQLLVEAKRTAANEADLIHWSELSRSGPIARSLLTETQQARMQVRDRRVLPFIELPATYDAYMHTLSKKLRSYLRRQERAAALQHGLTWHLNDQGTTLESAIEAFIDLHGECWRHRGQTGSFVSCAFVAFVRRFAGIAHRRGWLRLHRLCDGQRTVAALMAFHCGQRAYYYQGGWDPALAELSPGSLCIGQAVRSAIEEQLRTFDFLRGDEPHKRRWANAHDETVTIVEPVTARGRTALACSAAKESFKQGLSRVAGHRAWASVKSCLCPQ